MTNLNAKITAAAKASAGLGVAKATLLDRAADLIAADVTPARISRDGDLLAQFQDVTATAILSKEDRAIWADTSLAAKISNKGADGKRKQTNTPRGLLVDAVNSNIKRVRDAMTELLANPAARGTKAKKMSATEKFFKEMDGYVGRFSQPDASDKFEFDCITAKAALVKMLSQLR
jgi:hypothetical protein